MGVSKDKEKGLPAHEQCRDTRTNAFKTYDGESILYPTAGVYRLLF